MSDELVRLLAGTEARKRQPEARPYTTWRDFASEAYNNTVGSMLNRIAPGMLAEQQRPTLEAIMALDGGRYTPGPRESENASIDLSRKSAPTSPYERRALMQYLYGVDGDQDMLPGPR